MKSLLEMKQGTAPNLMYIHTIIYIVPTNPVPMQNRSCIVYMLSSKLMLLCTYMYTCTGNINSH